MYDMYVCRRHFGPSVSFAYSAVHGHLASGLGFRRQQVSRYGIHEDLTFLRQYGNSGAHASYYMAGARMEPDAEVVLCTMRIPGSFNKEKTKHTYQMSHMYHMHHGHSEDLGA